MKRPVGMKKWLSRFDRIKKASALIVDDEAEVRMIVRILLEDQGFEPIWEAEGGESAIEIVYKHRPDVVVLDYVMPGMDGEAVARAVKLLSPTTRILAFTAALGAKPDWADAYLGKAHLHRLAEEAEAVIEAVQRSLLR